MPAKAAKGKRVAQESAIPGSAAQDVFERLKADHRRVEELFSRFENADTRARAGIAKDTLRELAIHTRLEEEMVYPAIRDAIEQPDLIDEAGEEHHLAKLLMKELAKMKPGDHKFPAKFNVLGKIMRRHVDEEENAIFPQAMEANMDTAELSEAVEGRTATLLRALERATHSYQSRRRQAA